VNTLITAASLAQAHRLKSELIHEAIILGDYRDLPDVLLKSGKLIKLPNPGSISYTHEMLTLCLEKEIGIIYPLRDEEQKQLVNATRLFAEYGIKIKAEVG
jgi:hypothetical protein